MFAPTKTLTMDRLRLVSAQLRVIEQEANDPRRHRRWWER